MNRLHIYTGLIVILLLVATAYIDRTIREGLIALLLFVVGALFLWLGIKFVAYCDSVKKRFMAAFRED